jgi:hypothetical protein
MPAVTVTKMPIRQGAILFAALLLVWVIGLGVLRSHTSRQTRLFNDDNDRRAYAARGAWALNWTQPYRDVPSEYPQIATYFFGVPYLIAPGSAHDYRVYAAVMSGMTLAFLFATIVLLHRMRQAPQWTAYLLLLPGPLYFSYNRFDSLPGFIVLLSLFLLQRGAAGAAGVCLALGTFTKWYPALLLFACVSYWRTVERQFPWRLLAAFTITGLIVLTPTAVTGGIGALTQPYVFHANRGQEWASLPVLTRQLVAKFTGGAAASTFLTGAFLACSLLPAVAGVFARIDTFERVVDWALVGLGSFVLFSRIWSPQWVLWLMPLMILRARTSRDIQWIAAYGVLSYVTFPVLFDLAGGESRPLKLCAALVFLIIARAIVVAARNVWRSSSRSHKECGDHELFGSRASQPS